MPSVSVVIPAYNAEQFVGQALDSVLNQTFQDFEVLVVDDGSSDRTAELVTARYPRVQFVSQRNGGASSARNRGVEMATGEFVAFLDADDEWHPEKLQAQVALMRRYPDAVLGRTVFIEEPLDNASSLFSGGRTEPGLPDHYLVRDLAQSFLDPYFATSAVLVRRSAFQKVGGFDTGLKIAEDVDLYLRILAEAPLIPVVAKPALHKRFVPGSLGEDSEAGYVKLLEVYHRFLKDWPQAEKVLGRAVIDKGLAVLWARYAGSQFRNGKRPQAIRSALKSIRISPSMLGLRVLFRAVRP